MAQNQQSTKATTVLLIPLIIPQGTGCQGASGEWTEEWVCPSPVWGPLARDTLPPPPAWAHRPPALLRPARHKCWWARISHFSRLLLCRQLLSYAKKIPLLRVNCSISTIFQVEGSHQADSSRKTNLGAGSQAPGHRWGHLLVLPDPAAICKSARRPWEGHTGTRVRTAPSFSGACGFCCHACLSCWAP